MNDAIAKFNVQLRDKMKVVHDRLEALKVKTMSKAEHAEQEVLDHVSELKGRAHKAKVSLEAARGDMKKWAEETKSNVAEWKAKRDDAKLVARADRADRYAEAAFEVAIAGVEEAEKAMLDAWLARADAEAAKASKAA